MFTPSELADLLASHLEQAHKHLHAPVLTKRKRSELKLHIASARILAGRLKGAILEVASDEVEGPDPRKL